jgi:uncharacterized protein YrrD
MNDARVGYWKESTMMQKVNELFGKRVISQWTGNQVAIVREVVLDTDARQIVALIISDGRSSNEQVVRIGQILGMGEFVIVDDARPFYSSTSDAEIVELRKGVGQITGKKLMSAAGEQIGTISDMLFGRDGAIVGFELKHSLFDMAEPQVIRAADVQAIGKDAVITGTNQTIALSLLAEEEHGAAPTEVALPPGPVGEHADDAGMHPDERHEGQG